MDRTIANQALSLTDKAVQLSLTAPATPIATVLALLSKQAGVPILTDEHGGRDDAGSDDHVGQAAGPGSLRWIKLKSSRIPAWPGAKCALPKDAPLPKGAMRCLSRCGTCRLSRRRR